MTATRSRPHSRPSRTGPEQRLRAGVRRRIRQLVGALAWIIALAVGLSALAGLLSGGEWPWVVVTYLRWPQVVLIVLATIVLVVLRWWRSAIASAAVAAAMIASVVVPLTALRTVSTPGDGETLRIAVFNTGAGPGDVGAVAEAIRSASPDVAVLLESEDIAADLDRSLDDLTRLPTPVDGPVTSAPIVLARRAWPVDIEPLGDARPATIVAAEIGGQPVDIVAAHPLPPLTQSWARSHERSISMLIANVLPRPRPYVLACDCNSTPWTPSMRRLRTIGLRQPTVAATFAAPVIGMPLDHVLLGDGVGAVSRQLGPFAGSDHRMIVTEIALQGAQ